MDGPQAGGTVIDPPTALNVKRMNGSETLDATTAGPSPASQDRRLFRRYEFGLDATMICEDGSRQACSITDLSLGGAALDAGRPEWAETNVRLLWPDLDCEGGLEALVVRSTADRAHLSFTLDDAQESALTMFLVMSPATR